MKIAGFKYLCLAVLAFIGLGIESLYAYWLEPLIYRAQMPDWSTTQYIVHWSITCVTWSAVIYWIIGTAKKKYQYDIFKDGGKMKPWQWIAVAALALLVLVGSYFSWAGFKVVKEFQSNGLLKFVFQYLYYFFETGLFTLIIVFGQKAGEAWFGHTKIPYGGVVAALTWGCIHLFTKDLLTGLLAAVLGLAFGIVYLLVNRDVRKAYIILLIMFIL